MVTRGLVQTAAQSMKGDLRGTNNLKTSGRMQISVRATTDAPGVTGGILGDGTAENSNPAESRCQIDEESRDIASESGRAFIATAPMKVSTALCAICPPAEHGLDFKPYPI